MSLVYDNVAWSDFATEAMTDDSPIIRNVLLCGNSSRNGYTIPPRAFGGEERTRKLYEERLVFLDHDVKNPVGRSTKDLAGVVRNVRLVDGRPRGDIDTEAAPAGGPLLAMARKRMPGVGCSHTASYRLSADKRTVESVLTIYSVDIVIRPATTAGFYESIIGDDELLLDHYKCAYDKLLQEHERLTVGMQALEEAETRARDYGQRLYQR